MNMRFAFLTLFIFLTTFLGGRAPVSAEPLRIVYTAISLMYGPLWVTQDAGLFKSTTSMWSFSIFQEERSPLRR